ncbi:hypothetical protein KFK09_022703 [Dendrobium nobile]|uniref:Uncharacterized protein n=1 Tax=Dendrobium nobile TaxID=94219 RepID=A0A8T3AJH6_DENNO|nr:hypothetical protein KFK09_022703 [Dendrobium nobile]
MASKQFSDSCWRKKSKKKKLRIRPNPAFCWRKNKFFCLMFSCCLPSCLFSSYDFFTQNISIL